MPRLEWWQENLTMLDAYPPDLRDFVIQKIADGSFRSADEFAVEAASLYRDLEERRLAIRSQVQAGLDELDRSYFTEVSDAASLNSLFERIKTCGKVSLVCD
jgi:Arc/MetJ-type ribon-helix-helix transcriptional regulator